MSDQKTPINPFRYGREVELLVDRADEVARIVRIGENCGTLFFIGPRRYGKTSILRAAEQALTKTGIVVLRYDAEAFENIGLLAAALMTGALRKYASALDRAQAAAKKFFAALKPSLSIDPADGKITVGMGFDPAARSTQVPLLTDVLNGIERLAAADQRKALVVLDEFQQVVSEAGEKTERQIRAAVQTHHDVGYVFAGSSTRMMTDMISTSARAFWNLGDQLHLGPIPRRDFIPFLRTGLESAGAVVAEEALASHPRSERRCSLQRTTARQPMLHAAARRAPPAFVPASGRRGVGAGDRHATCQLSAALAVSVHSPKANSQSRHRGAWRLSACGGGTSSRLAAHHHAARP